MGPRVRIARRLGGLPRYHLDHSGAPPMNVPDAIRESVAFLQYQSGTGLRMAGTTFFVSVGEGELLFDYAVTAKHVVDAIRDKGVDGQTYFRMNLRDGGVDVMGLSTARWLYHPTDPATDLAVMEFPRGTPFALRVIPLPAMAATAEIITQVPIGIGDEVFMVGLFHHHYGSSRNIPVVRCGNIAAMPEEPVDVGGQAMEAYLVEMRSIGGLSGSPVFTWLLPFGRQHYRGTPIYLLGLMHGHWDIEADLLDELTPDQPRAQPLNTGIGVVVPVTKVLEALDQDRLAERRREEVRVFRAAQAPTADMGPTQ
jgi:hypothetical protein